MTLRSPLPQNLYASISIVKKKKRVTESKGSAQIASGFVPLNLLLKSQPDKNQARAATTPSYSIHGIISQSRAARSPLDTELLPSSSSSSSRKSPADRDFFAKVPSTHSRNTQDSTVKSIGLHKIMAVPEHEPLASRVHQFSLAEAGWYDTFITTSMEEIELQDHAPFTLLMVFTRIECRDAYYLSNENARPQMRASQCERYIYFGIGSRIILLPALVVGDTLERIVFSKTRVLIVLLSRQDYYLITHDGKDAKLRAFFASHQKWGIRKWATAFTMEEDRLSTVVQDCRKKLVDRQSSPISRQKSANSLPSQAIPVDDIDSELEVSSPTSSLDEVKELIGHGTTIRAKMSENPMYLRLKAPEKKNRHRLLASPTLSENSSLKSAPAPSKNANRTPVPSSPVAHNTSETISSPSSSEPKAGVDDLIMSHKPEPKTNTIASFADQLNLSLISKSRARASSFPSSPASSSSAPTLGMSKEISSLVTPSPIPSSGSVSPPPKSIQTSLSPSRLSPVVSQAESPITIELGLQIPAPFDPDLKHRFANNNSFTITYNDFKTLYNNEWINDSLIDFFIEYEIEAAAASVPDLERDHVYAFNSFFFTKLVSSSTYQDLPDYYANVKRWLLKVDLKKYDLVVIPINENAHWYACVIKGLPQLLEQAITHKAMESAIEVSDSEYKEDPEDAQPIEGNVIKLPRDTAAGQDSEATSKTDVNDPGRRQGRAKRSRQVAEIYVFDSLCQKHSTIKEPIKAFLVDYCKERYNVDVGTAQFKFINARVPKQNNFNDCGVHVIYNIRKWLREMADCEAAWRMLYPKNSAPIRRIFPADERGTMRSQLIDILLGLHDKQLEGGAGDRPRCREENDDDDDDDIEVIGFSRTEGHVSLDDTCLPLSYTRYQRRANALVKSRSMLELGSEKTNALEPVKSADASSSTVSTRTLDPRAVQQTLPLKPTSPVSVQPRKPSKINAVSKETGTSPPRRRSPHSRSRLSPSIHAPPILNESIRARLSSDKTKTNPLLVKQLNMWFRNKHTTHLNDTLDEIHKMHLKSLEVNDSELIAICSEFPKRYKESVKREGDVNRPRNQKLVIMDSEPLGYGDDWGLAHPREEGNGNDSTSHSNGEHSSEEDTHALSDEDGLSAAQILATTNEVPKRRRIQVIGPSSP